MNGTISTTVAVNGFEGVLYSGDGTKNRVMIVMSGSNGGMKLTKAEALFYHKNGIPALALGKMVSKCGCVGTHPMLGILLANRFRFAGSDCHRAGGFEPITPYPAIVLMLLYCGNIKRK